MISGAPLLCEWGENVHLYDVACNEKATIVRHVPFTEAIGDPSNRTKETYVLCNQHSWDDMEIIHCNPAETDTVIHDGD